jgi:amino acid transporter
MQDTSAGFARVLKSRDVLVLSFGAMVGWSWVLLSGHWVSSGGSLGAALAFLVGGGAITLIGLLYAELASAMPKTGGEHVYTHRGLGYNASFACTWALLMAYLAICLFEAVALPTALEYLVPAVRFGALWDVQGSPVNIGFVVIGVVGSVAVTWINVLGIRVAAMVQTILTLAIVSCGILLMTGALSFGEIDMARPWFVDGAAGVMVVLITVPGMLVGFDVIPQSAEEIDLEPRRIGWLLVLSVVVAVIWYALVTLSVAMGGGNGGADGIATADAASTLWGGAWAGQVLVLGGIGGILTSWNAFLIGASRVMYAMAESGGLPRAFARLHPQYRTPYVGIITIGGLSCLAPLFGRTVLVWLIDAGSFAIVIAYLFVAAAFLALRKNEPDMPRPFKVPAGRAVGWVAVAVSILLLNLYMPGSPSHLVWPQEWIMVLVWIALGVVVFSLPSSTRAD